MATFLIGLVILFVGAAIYGKFCEKAVPASQEKSAAKAKKDKKGDSQT